MSIFVLTPTAHGVEPILSRARVVPTARSNDESAIFWRKLLVRGGALLGLRHLTDELKDLGVDGVHCFRV